MGPQAAGAAHLICLTHCARHCPEEMRDRGHIVA